MLIDSRDDNRIHRNSCRRAVHREVVAGAAGRRNAARCVLVRHAGRDRATIAGEVAGIYAQAIAQAFSAAQVYDLGAELCAIAQGQRHLVAYCRRTADRAADGGGPNSIDGGGKSHRIDADLRRGGV